MENIPAIKLLLAHDAKLFIKNKKGKTPFDLSKERILVRDLFANDKKVNRLVEFQELRHAILSDKD